MIFWQEGFSFDSTRDILNKDGSLRTWEKISVQEEEVALPSSWTQSLACCDTWQCFTPQMFLSALRIFFLGIFLYVFSPSFLMFHFPLLPLVETAGFNERYENQQIIPNRNVQPWSWTLLPDALCLLVHSSP